MNESYEEVPTEDFTVSDYVFIGTGIIVICFVVAFVLKQIRKTFKNVHLKIGDKVEVGIETKEEK